MTEPINVVADLPKRKFITVKRVLVVAAVATAAVVAAKLASGSNDSTEDVNTLTPES